MSTIKSSKAPPAETPPADDAAPEGQGLGQFPNGLRSALGDFIDATTRRVDLTATVAEIQRRDQTSDAAQWRAADLMSELMQYHQYDRQQDLADAIGCSQTHVSRCIKIVSYYPGNTDDLEHDAEGNPIDTYSRVVLPLRPRFSEAYREAKKPQHVQDREAKWEERNERKREVAETVRDIGPHCGLAPGQLQSFPSQARAGVKSATGTLEKLQSIYRTYVNDNMDPQQGLEGLRELHAQMAHVVAGYATLAEQVTDAIERLTATTEARAS